MLSRLWESPSKTVMYTVFASLRQNISYCAYGGSRSTDLRFILFILRSIFTVFNQPIHQSNDKFLVIQFIFNIYWFRLGFVSYFGLYFYRGCLGLLCISLQIGYFGFLIFSLDWSIGLIWNFIGNLLILSRRSCVRFVTFVWLFYWLLSFIYFGRLLYTLLTV